MRAAIYCRISQDRKGHAAGVERQRADCLALCEARGWAVAAELVDNDVSAYSGKERPEYTRLVGMVAAGEVDVVVAWHSDRLWRDVLDQQVFLATGRQAGLELVATPSSEFRPGDADGEFFSTLLAAVARKASADHARRIRRKHQEKAERGEFAGGPRAFGHTADRKGLVEAEAEALRDAARRILAGTSTAVIAQEWHDAGFSGTLGARWSPSGVRRVLSSGRVAGLRMRDGVAIGKAAWPAIIDVATWEALVALFGGRRHGPHGAARRYLLSGVLVCSKCGARMSGGVISKAPRYVCPPPYRGGCSGLVTTASHTDRVVVERVVAHVASEAFAARVATALEADQDASGRVRAVSARLDVDRGRLASLAGLWAAGEIGRGEWMEARRVLAESVAAAEGELAILSASGAVAAMPSADVLAEEWPSMTLDEQRAVLAALVDHVLVLPSRGKGRRFDEGRLVIEWA